VYLALKLGALPWPIFFVVLFALFALKALARVGARRRRGSPGGRDTNINEANVSATVMTAGAMVAGGLAFTIPGIYLLDPAADVSVLSIMLCALCGVVLGCIGTALMRRHFIEDSALPFPIGTGAAKTLVAGDTGGRKAILLFAAMGVSGAFGVARDALAALPSILFSWVSIPGVRFGIYCSPMALAMGFLIGVVPALVWLVGGLVGDFGIVVGMTALGVWDTDFAQGVKLSLGIGVMIGCGIGIVVKVVAAKAVTLLRPTPTASSSRKGGASDQRGRRATLPLRWAPFAVAGVFAIMAALLGLGVVESLLCVALVWVVMAMAAQCTGQAGLNPMEVFGLVVLLTITIVSRIGGVEAFLVTAVATVCCGFVGDLMNDFKAGHLLKTSPRAQWLGEAIGGIVGAVVGAAVIAVLITVYGPESFGPEKQFVAAQASAVSALVGGIPNLPAFGIGAASGLVLYLLGAPVITLGLGIYLPFYLSLTVALGAAARFVSERVAPRWTRSENSTVLASGLLAGESIVGILIALVFFFGGMLGGA
jgi:uncharacterized oligopeptide transporter (OPT) family protein